MFTRKQLLIKGQYAAGIPNAWRRMPTKWVTPADKLVAATLIKYLFLGKNGEPDRWYTYVSWETIAKENGLTINGVEKCLIRMEKLGMIGSETRDIPNKNGEIRRLLTYFFKWGPDDPKHKLDIRTSPTPISRSIPEVACMQAQEAVRAATTCVPVPPVQASPCPSGYGTSSPFALIPSEIRVDDEGDYHDYDMTQYIDDDGSDCSDNDAEHWPYDDEGDQLEDDDGNLQDDDVPAS